MNSINQLKAKFSQYHLKYGRKFILLCILVISLPLIIGAVIIGPRILSSATGNPTLTASFAASSTTLPPDSTLTLKVNTGTHPVSFAASTITFVPSKIHLVSVQTASSPLTRLILPIDIAQANSTGQLRLVLGLEPNSTPPAGNLSLAQLVFTSVSSTPNDSTQVGFATLSSEYADPVPTPFSATFTPLSLTLNPSSPTPTRTPTPTPIGPPPSPTPTPTPGGGTTQTTLTAEADAKVDSQEPAQNFGSAKNLRVTKNPEVNSLFKFDLRPLAGKQVVSARLRLLVVDGGPSETRHLLYRAGNDWDEDRVNFNNQPPLRQQLGELTPTCTTCTLEPGLDASVVQNQLGARITIEIKSDKRSAAYASRESDSASGRPQLVIEYR